MVTTTEIADNVRAFMRDGTELVRKEVQLAKLETGEKVELIARGAVYLIVGLFMLMVAIFFLAQALVWGLAILVGSVPLANLIVGAIIAAIGVFLALKGKNNLSAENLRPSRTLRTTERGVEKLREAA